VAFWGLRADPKGKIEAYTFVGLKHLMVGRTGRDVGTRWGSLYLKREKRIVAASRLRAPMDG